MNEINPKKFNLKTLEDAQLQMKPLWSPILDHGTFDQLPTLADGREVATELSSQESGVDIGPVDEIPTRMLSAIQVLADGREVTTELSSQESGVDIGPIDEVPTRMLSAIQVLADGREVATELWGQESGVDIGPVDEVPTRMLSAIQVLADGREVATELWGQRFGVNIWPIDEAPTWMLPVIHIDYVAEIEPEKVAGVGTEGQVAMLRRLVKSSGIYALSSVALPLVSLVLAPFLTHSLSPSDYGILTILTTAISLATGITQLGLASAFFRTYSYDYSSRHDRRDVVATATALLCLVSIPTAIMVVVTSPFLANLLLGQSSLGGFVSLAGGVVLVQNLTVPGLAWMRAENRPLLYSLLSIGGLLITLLANIVLVGVLHWGVAGSVIANGSGYACMAICTMPIIVLRTGIRIRVDIARNLLAFGLPLILNIISYWVLQFSDRYLLSLFASLAETARYAVVYTLGSAMSVVIVLPFMLAWPTTMFAIAKRKDAVQIFVLIFRWFSMFLLFAAFSLSLVGTFLLDWLFPATYRSASFIIPIVASSIVFYAFYFLFNIGTNMRRKTWLASIFTTIAALVNLAVNLILIPHYGATGAAVSTLIAYIVLAFVAYVINQRLYPIPFEIGRFIIALFVGAGLYVGSSILVLSQSTYVAWGIYAGALALYGSCLAILGKLPSRSQSLDSKNRNIRKGVIL